MDKAAADGAGEELKSRRADLRKYLEALAENGDPEALKLRAVGYFDLASNLREAEEFAEAEACYADAEVALLKLAEHNRYASFANSQLAACKNHLGLLNLEKGDYSKAATVFDEAIAMREQFARRSPKDDENLVFLGGALCNRGIATRDMRQNEAAQSYFQKSLQVLDPLLSRCECGSAEALAVALSRMTGAPHWLLLAFRFRKNASEGLASVKGEEV
jgi:tetratricopeptide (TPR) repeat protein